MMRRSDIADAGLLASKALAINISRNVSRPKSPDAAMTAGDAVFIERNARPPQSRINGASWRLEDTYHQ